MAALALGAILVAGCGTRSSSDPADPPVAAVPAYAVTLSIVDEIGSPVGTASVELPGGAVADASPAGEIELLELVQPTLLVVRAPGFLPEPVVVDRSAAGTSIPVPLLAELGPGGERRLVLHFGGDAMLGRRYLEPTRGDTAIVITGDGGVSARAVVSALSPLFLASDVRSINLETVVGTLSMASAYPKKRFLLQSPPEVLDLLDELGIDIVTLGNNHTRDWLDVGVESTVDALALAGLPYVGGGIDIDDARAVEFVDHAAGGYRVGFLSYTSVNGDFVNDRLPSGPSVVVPPDLPASEEWQYELRSFEFSGPTVSVPREDRRIGDVWQLFKTAEKAIPTAGEIADYWTAVETVYPEMQDWVARRGHGGANPYDKDQVEADIAALRASGCDLVVVQLHTGFQFFEVKSELTEKASHRAIEAGADLVVCHHPHVLQGFEWYDGSLIAYSLGNLIFDQDFLATFPTVVLRVVFEETDILEARCLPVAIDRYRPVPIGGKAAERIIRTIHAGSVLPVRSERLDGEVVKVLRDPPLGVVPADFVWERGSGRIGDAPRPPTTADLALGAGEVAAIDGTKLTHARAADGGDLTDIEFGRDLFGWGSFEDLSADGEPEGGHYWKADASHKRIEVIPSGAPSGVRALRLRRSETNSQRTLVRPVARTPFRRHDLFEEGATSIDPVDGEPSYSLFLTARLNGGGSPHVRFDIYDFDDTDPTADPESRLVRSVDYPLDIENDGEWHRVELDLPAALFASTGDLEPNMAMFYLGLTPPSENDSVLVVDDLEFIQWRRATDLPAAYYAVDQVRNSGAGGVGVRLKHVGG